MSTVETVGGSWSKRRILYTLMVALGAVFVSTAVLPLESAISQLVAVLAFGVMTGLWLAHLIYSL